MNNNIDYLLCFISLVFILLSVMYTLKFHKLKNTGKIPYIIGAKQRQILFFILAVLSALIMIID